MNRIARPFAFLVLASLYSPATAGVILVDFGTASASPTLGGTWNELAVSGSGSVELDDSSGTGSGATLSWTGFGTGIATQGAWGADVLWVDADATADTFHTVGSTSTDSIVTIAGLAPGNYSLDLVASRSQGPAEARVSDYRLNGVFADSIPNGDDFNANTDGYIAQSILTWNSVSLDSSGNLVLTIDEPVSSFGYLTALRISEANPVPEPSTFLLAGCGLLGLLTTHRKRTPNANQCQL